jgi:hypothetical protein
MEKIEVKKEGEIFTLKPSRIGSIQHTFRVLDGRATLIESPHNNTLKGGLSMTCAAQVDEVESLISVLEMLKDQMLKSKLEAEIDSAPEIEVGTWVETGDGRYGRIKKVDWFSKSILNRKDYQIQFPDGVGIFRRDEFSLCNN